VPGVAQAASELRYSGVHPVVDVCVQPSNGEDPSEELLWEVRRSLAEVRRLGDEVRVHAPQYRALRITLTITLTDDADRDQISTTVGALLGSGMTVDNTPALFHPTRLGFGQSVWASAVVAAVQNVPGVTEVDLGRFAFADDDSHDSTPPVMLVLSGLQLARLDNDPAHPERGSVSLTMRSGR
jgi:phage-related baseplate assembly protein